MDPEPDCAELLQAAERHSQMSNPFAEEGVTVADVRATHPVSAEQWWQAWGSPIHVAAPHEALSAADLVRVPETVQRPTSCCVLIPLALCLAALVVLLSLALVGAWHWQARHQFGCSADYDDWQRRWPLEKQLWCCEHEGRGCHQ